MLQARKERILAKLLEGIGDQTFLVRRQSRLPHSIEEEDVGLTFYNEERIGLTFFKRDTRDFNLDELLELGYLLDILFYFGGSQYPETPVILSYSKENFNFPRLESDFETFSIIFGPEKSIILPHSLSRALAAVITHLLKFIQENNFESQPIRQILSGSGEEEENANEEVILQDILGQAILQTDFEDLLADNAPNRAKIGLGSANKRLL